MDECVLNWPSFSSHKHRWFFWRVPVLPVTGHIPDRGDLPWNRGLVTIWHRFNKRLHVALIYMRATNGGISGMIIDIYIYIYIYICVCVCVCVCVWPWCALPMWVFLLLFIQGKTCWGHDLIWRWAEDNGCPSLMAQFTSHQQSDAAYSLLITVVLYIEYRLDVFKKQNVTMVQGLESLPENLASMFVGYVS